MDFASGIECKSVKQNSDIPAYACNMLDNLIATYKICNAFSFDILIYLIYIKLKAPITIYLFCRYHSEQLWLKTHPKLINDPEEKHFHVSHPTVSYYTFQRIHMSVQLYLMLVRNVFTKYLMWH